MLSRQSKINKYGGHSWQIELESLYHIFIHETETSSFVIECKEWKWLGYKTHFSFVSDKSLEQTIIDSFSRVYEFAQNKNAAWSPQSQSTQLKNALDLLSQYSGPRGQQKEYTIRENGYYITRLSENNPDTRRPYVVFVILIFKGNQCIEFQEEGPIEPSEINNNIFQEFNPAGSSNIMTYEARDNNFYMRFYKSEDKDQWDEWTGKLVEDGLMLTMNSHFFSYGHMKLVDSIMYTNAHFGYSGVC